MNHDIVYRLNPTVTNAELNTLFEAAWRDRGYQDFSRVLKHSLAYVAAYEGRRLIGFVNLAWDGGVHAFLLDTTVEPHHQHRGIGVELVRRAIQAARDAGCEWLHVDYEAQLAPFYDACGFTPTSAGLIRLV